MNSRNVSDYVGLTPKRHVLERKETYLGPCGIDERNHIGLNIKDRKLVDVKTDTPEGIYRCFLEVISNAGDNADSSRREGIDPGIIEVFIEDDLISVKNEGISIPIKQISLIKKDGKITTSEKISEGDETLYLPTFIFGRMMTSNNYDDTKQRMGCGRNGFGAKITNICSNYFCVEIVNSNKKYKGVWKDNMYAKNDKNPEIVISNVEEKDYVKITWKIDFSTFKLERTKYTEEDISIIARIVADFSYTCKVITKFNGETFDYRSIKDYSSLIFDKEELSNSFIKYIFSEGSRNLPIKKLHKIVKEAKNVEDIPTFEFMILDTPNNSRIFSYVNGLMTREGGTHTVAVLKNFIKYICDTINRDKDKDMFHVTPKKVEQHLSFIITVRVTNPEYSGQTKEKLISPKISPIKYSELELSQISSWKVFDIAQKEFEMYLLQKNNVKTSRKRHIDIKGLKDANKAGTKESKDCTLFIVEGNSAAGYPEHRIPELEGDWDHYGILPIRGKILNVSKIRNDIEKYISSEIINKIKEVCGLQDLLDYSLEENRNTMRYGKICIMVDADDDGFHILCLLLNLFREKFKGLINAGRIGYLRTPVVKIYKTENKVWKRFFSNDEFTKWRKENIIPKGYKIKYLKGLGSSNENDIKDDLNWAPTIICFYDSKAENNFEMAFCKEAALRKEWLKEWREKTGSEDALDVDINDLEEFFKDYENFLQYLIKGQNASQLIQRELVQYTITSLYRAIPSFKDLLKVSQRKILTVSLNHWKFGRGRAETQKIGRFSGKVGNEVGYHHGEVSLCKAIISLSQDFVGMNNMPLLISDSQNGTRLCGGKNAAEPRYSSFKLNPLVKYIVDEESFSIVPKTESDGEVGEPVYIPFIVPVGIINGVSGMATAYSTFIPNYEPNEVIDYLMNLCKEEKVKKLEPWYNKFQGSIDVNDKKRNDKIEEESDTEEEKKFINRESKFTMVTTGTYELVKETPKAFVLRITELPIGVWCNPFYEKLTKLVLDKSNKKILDCKNNSSPNKCDITVYLSKDVQYDEKMLGLERSYGISNITTIDENGFPFQFKTIDDLMKVYFKSMIEHFTKLRNYLIEIKNDEIKDLDYRIKFIMLVLNEEIVVLRKNAVPEEEIAENMEKHHIPNEYYHKVKIREFSKESIEKYRVKKNKLLEELEEKKKTTPQQIWLKKLEVLKVELAKYWNEKNNMYIWK